MKLFTHPRIYIDAHGRLTDAVLVDNGRVVALGERAAKLAAEGQVSAQKLDGACVMPALADAHIHMWGLGMRAGSIDLRDVQTTEEIYERISNAPETEHGWILGSGWDQNRWEDSNTLDLDRLDAASQARKVCLRRIDEHAIWVNSKALDTISIDEGPLVGRDAEGNPNGLLVDEMMFKVTRQIPEASESEDEATCIKNAEMLRSMGIASVHIAWVEGNRLSMLQRLMSGRKLGLRVHPMLDGNAPEFMELFADGPLVVEEGVFHLQAAKFFADGAVGSKGAQMLDGYSDGSYGAPVVDDDVLSQRIPELVSKGWQVCVHAIGDRANRRMLNHYNALSIAERARTRPRIEHAQMVHPDDIDRFFDIVASVQPIHLYSDAPWVHHVLAEEHLDRLFQWKTIGERSRLICGSDFPIDDPNPWHGISVAQTRRHRDDNTFNPSESMSRFQAIHGYTQGAAYGAFWEDEIGSLRPGKRADFIATDTDPFTSTPSEIWDTGVLGLWMDGDQG